MLTARLVGAHLLGVAAAGLQAHTLDLGEEIAVGACSTVEAVDAQAFRQTSRIQYYDGKIPVSAVVIPSQELPGGRPDDLMTTCSRKAAEQLERSRPAAAAQPEEAFRSLLNKCLSEGRARYQATAVLFRRGPVICAPAAPPARSWQDELRAGLQWCGKKDNIFSRSICEYRERNRFCTGDRVGTVAECQP